MRKKISLSVIALGLLMSSTMFTSCEKDDDDNQKKTENVNDTTNLKLADLEGEIAVDANLMDMVKWVELVTVKAESDTLLTLTFTGKDMPQDSYHIADAKFENIKATKEGSKFTLSDSDEKFAATLSMSQSAEKPLTVYSTNSDDAKLTIKSIGGYIDRETLKIEILLSAGRMPITIPLTLESLKKLE